MIVVSLDPGVHTGIAAWDIKQQKLTAVGTMKIHQAMKLIEEWSTSYGEISLVMFEDARKRRWFGKTGKEVWQGAGSIKRDCSILEDWLTDLKIPFLAVAPKTGMTKLHDDQFSRITGWKERTSEHARDAAMITYGITAQHLAGLLRATNKWPIS